MSFFWGQHGRTVRAHWPSPDDVCWHEYCQAGRLEQNKSAVVFHAFEFATAFQLYNVNHVITWPYEKVTHRKATVVKQ